MTNVSAHQDAETRLVTIRFDLADPDSATVRVGVEISADGGATWNVPAASLAGTGIGDAVKPGLGRLITWNAPPDWPENVSSQMKFRVTASDDPAPAGMALIPAGNFQMGNAMDPDEGESWEMPVHTVYVSAFYMDRYEVTEALWNEVRAWGLTHGYTDLPEGRGKAAAHPAPNISWYDMVKWCNARSEKEGLTPVYFTNDAQTGLYQTGSVDVTNSQVKWSANGYRLPTEAEWEKAARGGLSGKRFPWGDTISHSQANYVSTAYYSYDVSPTRGYHPAYYDENADIYTSPVGSFAPNGYGLYDMAGNVWELCWDWWGSGYYSTSPNNDPQGPPPDLLRVIRGGVFYDDASHCRAASRFYAAPGNMYNFVGFRSVRR